jgi:hypothetical protein
VKKWVPCDIEQCEEHGNDIEILTDAKQPAVGVAANDGDLCRCPEGCRGWMTADDGSFYANWDEPKAARFLKGAREP